MPAANSAGQARTGRLLALYSAITNQPLVGDRVFPVSDAIATGFIESEKAAAIRAIRERSYGRLNFHLERLTALLNHHRTLAPAELPQITLEWVRLKMLVDPPHQPEGTQT